MQVGTDVDALAIKAALDNAKLNGVDSNFTALQCSASVQVRLHCNCWCSPRVCFEDMLCIQQSDS